jgi:hypothetical protein
LKTYLYWLVVLLFSVIITGCNNATEISSTQTDTIAAPPFTQTPTITPTPTSNTTLRPEKTRTEVPIPSIIATLTPQLTSVAGWFYLTPEPTIPGWWFPIPEITHPDIISRSTAKSYKGLKIPPLSDDLAIEFDTGQPYGELSSEPIFYQLFLIRKGNARMLWLGIPFKWTTDCCEQGTPYRIYDSIPFPPSETKDLLIPFVCTRNQEYDIFLIVVAEPPEKGASATKIRYAWRIDQATVSLQPVSTQGIECSP